MSLLFTENNPEKCERCGSTQFILSPIVQITSDKHEQHVTGYLAECVSCNNKRILPSNYFGASKR